jgi:hypothetical protein
LTFSSKLLFQYCFGVYNILLQYDTLLTLSIISITNITVIVNKYCHCYTYLIFDENLNKKEANFRVLLQLQFANTELETYKTNYWLKTNLNIHCCIYIFNKHNHWHESVKILYNRLSVRSIHVLTRNLTSRKNNDSVGNLSHEEIRCSRLDFI